MSLYNMLVYRLDNIVLVVFDFGFAGFSLVSVSPSILKS